jgi:hypothetical protein
VRGHGNESVEAARLIEYFRIAFCGAQVLYFLNSDEMSPNRFRWAADLVSVARSMRKHTMAATLQRILAE